MNFQTFFSSFRLTMILAGQEIGSEQFHLQPCTAGMTGSWQGYDLTVYVSRRDGGLEFFASLEKDGPVSCSWICAEMVYETQQPERCLVPGGGFHVGIAGLHRLSAERFTPEDSQFCGLFRSSTEPCLLLGTVIPQHNLHVYQAKLLGENRICLQAKTKFTTGQGQLSRIETEKTLVITGKTPLAAMEAYAAHVPMLPKMADPLVGWSTWDYYFTDITPADLTENLQAIAADPVLSEKMKCFLVDDGWQHREGEWVANYKFPRGMADVAEEIRSHGLVPGIWTNGCQAFPLTHTALRHPERLLRDTAGNVIMADGLCLLDPTHPAAEEYLFRTYCSLYEDGFRIFKVDFVSNLLFGDNFHDQACGPYEAIRRLFAIIRRAVGPDSHILGCSYPGVCGAGIVDSCRISVDIHNHWSHVRWVMMYWQMKFWENGRLYRSDPDYLVVRGFDTSTEAETNVTNFAPNAPYAEGAPGNRWRRGPVFDRIEAETWANIIHFVGGNVVSSDRLTVLNDEGMTILKRHLDPGTGAVPLDLGEQELAAYWYSKQEQSLLLINHAETEQELCFRFAQYGLAAPAAIRCEKTYSYDGAALNIRLQRHESAVVFL